MAFTFYNYFEIYRGDSYKLEFTLKDSENKPIDLSTCEVWFTLQSNKEDKVVLDKLCKIKDPKKGKCYIKLEEEETNIPGDYIAELELRDYSPLLINVLSGSEYVSIPPTSGTKSEEIITVGRISINIIDDIRK